MQSEITMRPPTATYRDITPEAAHRVRGTARLIDVREAIELRTEGAIPGAEHVPLATVETMARAWNRDEELVLICRAGGRSARAAELLVAMGFRRVMNMTGGVLAYRAAGLPLT
jgi:rhodanese-related sulfurtransferase